MTTLLRAIEAEGAQRGLSLNKANCEAMIFHSNQHIRFLNGEQIREVEEASYLGCFLNKKTDAQREIQARFTDCIVTWKKLDPFWRHSDCTVAQKSKSMTPSSAPSSCTD